MAFPRSPISASLSPVVGASMMALGLNFAPASDLLLAAAEAYDFQLAALIADLFINHWPIWAWVLATSGGILALEGPLNDVKNDLRTLHRLAAHRCVPCGYDLRGCPHATCPECGAAASPAGVPVPA